MIFTFTDFELDTGKFELRQGDEPVAIEPQVFAIIQLLVENPDRMVTKSEIMDVVWGGRIVSEGAVSSRIRSARAALGDNGKAQRVIRTVHGKGLRFVVDVSTRESQPSTDHGAADVAKTESQQIPTSGNPLPDLKNMPSIAVIPFEILSEHPEDKLFADGLTEETVSNLARFRNLFVFSRVTTSSLKRRDAAISQYHDELGVDFIVDATIRKTTKSIRVNMRLIDAATEGHILSEQLERPSTPDGLFEIQDDIALRIASRIGDQHGPLAQLSMRMDRPGRSRNWETYYLTSKFHRYFGDHKPSMHAKLKTGLREALERDPGSSDGWAAFSMIHVDEYRLRFHKQPQPALLEDALAYARKSVALDPENALCFLALGLSRFYRREFADSENAMRRGLELNPGNAISLAITAMSHCQRNEFEKARPLAERAIELSPVHPGWYRMPLACGLFMEGKTEEAILEQRKTPAPGYYWYHAHLASYYAHVNDKENMKKEVSKLLDVYPDFDDRIETEGKVHCIARPFFNRMAEGWRKAGFNVRDRK